MKRKNAKLVCFFLSLLLAMGNPISALAAWENPFTDVKSRDWFYDAVEYVNTEGLFNGTAPDKFSPEVAMSRWNEMVEVIDKEEVWEEEVGHWEYR